MFQYAKVRGQKRKFQKLFMEIDNITPRFDFVGEYEHYHIPCGFWISSPKNSSKRQTEFCRRWIAQTEKIIDSKPQTARFCKVVAVIVYPHFWDSQITVFYDEDYYNDFFTRTGPYQTWTKIQNRSFAQTRNIQTTLTEQGYDEVIDNHSVCEDEDEIFKDQLWFYGELNETKE